MLRLVKLAAILIMLPGLVGILAGLLALLIAGALGDLDLGRGGPFGAVLTSSAAFLSGVALFALATVLHQIRVVRATLASGLGDGPAPPASQREPT